jgi:peptide/nickel transport system ATP-binding protein/oligopeptide transport system ATP-binding protein
MSAHGAAPGEAAPVDLSSPARAAAMAEPLLSVRNLDKTYRNGVHAVCDVSFDLAKGEIVGLVGESGCGKSSLSRLLLRLVEPDAGRAIFDGRSLFNIRGTKLRKLRRRLQLVPQSPTRSLNPRLPARESVLFNLVVNGWSNRDAEARLVELLDLVGVSAQHANRYPHELSGGQIQRLALARALATSPDLVICDEAVSALDKSVQAQVLNLLTSLLEELKVTFLFISHDLDVVGHVSDRVMVMYLGRIVEQGDAKEVLTRPLHPYTQGLLDSVPGSGRALVALQGEPPSPVDPPSGCPFRTRCPVALPECARYDHTPVVDAATGVLVRCLRISAAADSPALAG